MNPATLAPEPATDVPTPPREDAPEEAAALHRLFFLRHAPAGEADDWTGPDEERPLTETGRKKLKQQKKGLRNLIGAPDVIVSSHYARAWQTAEAVARQLNYTGEIEKSESLGHGGDPADLDAILANRAPGASLLLVGHSPDLERWIARLVGAADPRFIEIKKGGVCRIDVALVDGVRIATLKWLVTPGALRDYA